MTIDCVDAAADPLDIFENQNDQHATAIWNGREIRVVDPNSNDPLSAKAQAIIQALNEEKKQQFLDHHYEQLNSLEEQDSEEIILDCAHDYVITLLNNSQSSQYEIVQCGLWKRLVNGVKKAAKKAAKAFKKVFDAVKKAAEDFLHGTKKAAEKVADFVKDHKKETLIAAAIIAAIAGAFVISGALSGGAAATGGGTPTRKKEDEDDKTSPPADPPPLPDWINDLLKSTAADFSPDKLTDDSLDSAKKEAHDAWDLFNRLKSETENGLAPLKEFKPEFNPSTHAVETILNTVLQDPKTYEFSKNLISSQSWSDVVQSGHDKIDYAFTTLRNQTTIPLPPPKPPPSFLDKIRLGLEIIGRGMMEPELLDPNLPLDIFIKKENIDTSIEVSNQTVGNFVETTTNGFKTDHKSLNDFIATLQAQTPGASKDSIPKLGKIDLPFEVKTEATSPPLRSSYFKIEGAIRDSILITFINGMGNLFEEAQMNAKHLQKLCAFNPSIEGIYNHTNGRLIDALEIFNLNYKGYSPITQDLLIQKWTEFYQQNKDNSEAKVLHFCHSQGAIHTKNALLHLPEEVRSRVIVVAIAPATVISRSLCHASFNYASRNDIVPCGELLAAYWRACDIGEMEREEMLINISNMQNELIWLTPHDKAGKFDHEFQSPTFAYVIRFHLDKYDKGDY
jgi:hypothetical protein